MITQQQLDEQGERVKALGDQIQNLAVIFHEESDKLKKMIATWKIEALVYGEEAKFFVNTQAPLNYETPTPALVVLDVPQTPETGTLSDLGRVRVDWWYDARKQQPSGKLSDGSYQVKAVKGDYLEIAFELDVERVMTVAKKRTEAA